MTRQLKLYLMTVLVGFLGCGTQMPGGMNPSATDVLMLIFGDGSAGARTIEIDEDWSVTYPPNLQFTDFTVNAGRTFTVPSGTTIRCTGTFTNNGTIRVLNGASGGSNRGAGGGVLVPYNGPPEAGIALGAAVNGDYGDNTSLRVQGDGGVGVGSLQARQILNPGPKAGGGGGTIHITIGTSGGGSLRVLARGAILNSVGSIIEANGGVGGGISGRGGAGGGVVILASRVSVTNNGTLRAHGSAGGNSSDSSGPGGGGGGGIVHLISPTISPAGGGAVAVIGGAPGSISGMVTQPFRSGGGGGGACRGDGGQGGFVPAGASVTPSAAQPGQPGELLLTQLDPTTLF